MRIFLIYFSQTGNTHKLTEALARGFRSEGHSARVSQMQDSVPDEALGSDLVGFGSPCFSSHAPTPVKGFLRSLPPMPGLRTFVFSTTGGASGRVLYDLSSVLHKKGANVLAGFKAPGEVHHPAPHMSGRRSGRPNAADLAAAERFSVSLLEHVSNRDSGTPTDSPKPLRPTRPGFYEILGTLNTDRMVRFLMPAPTPLMGICDQCGWCVDACPMNNISLGSAPMLGDRCIRCYRCLTGCPSGALSANWHYADRFLQCFYNEVLMRRFGDLDSAEWILY